MKKMLIASAAVGATIAGLILYSRKRNDRKELGSENRIASKSGDGSVKTSWNPAHSMG